MKSISLEKYDGGIRIPYQIANKYKIGRGRYVVIGWDTSNEDVLVIMVRGVKEKCMLCGNKKYNVIDCGGRMICLRCLQKNLSGLDSRSE